MACRLRRPIPCRQKPAGSTDSPFSVGAQYKNGPFLVFADYITSDDGGDDSAYKLGGKYELGMFSFLAQYEFDDGLISARGANQVNGWQG